MAKLAYLPTGDLAAALNGADSDLFSVEQIDDKSFRLDRKQALTAGETYRVAVIVFDTDTGIIGGISGPIGPGADLPFALGDGSGLSAAGISVTQLVERSVAQRSTSTGGLFGKGYGAHKVRLNLSQPASVEFRTRDAEANSDSAALQDWSPVGNLAAGDQTLVVPGVAARKGWHFLDLRFNGDNTMIALGTAPVGMGRVIALSGQSLAVRLLGKMDGQTATLASLGITPSAYGTVFATYADGQRTVVRSGWQFPADGGDYDSAGAAELLNDEVASKGVTCAIIGWMMGSQTIESFIGNTSNGNELNKALDDAGGAFEHCIWLQGHSNAAEGTTTAQYKAYLDQLFAQIGSHNSRPYTKLLCAIPNITSTDWGTADQIAAVRQGAHDWAQENGALYAQPMNIDLVDGTHESQLGAKQLADYFSAQVGIDPVTGTGTGTSPGTGTGSDPGTGTGGTGGTGGSRLWTLNDLSVKPAKWMDLMAPGVALADGANISKIVNLGSESGDFVQATADYQPQYMAAGAGDGLPAANFNAGQLLQAPMILTSATVFAMMVLRKDGPYQNWRAMSATEGGADYDSDKHAALIMGGVGGDYIYGSQRGGTQVKVAGSSALAIVCVYFDGTNAYIRINGGTPISLPKSGTFLSTMLTIGGYYNGTQPAYNDMWFGLICEAALLYAVPAEAEIKKIIGGAAWKWKMQTASGGVLPSTDPFYAAAPTA